MKKKTIKLSLRKSLILMAAIPFIGFVTTLLIQINARSSELKTISTQVLNTDFVFSSSNLIGSIQKERGLSASLINGADTKLNVDAMRSNVDTLYITTTNKFYHVSFFNRGETSFNTIESKLSKMRKAVDNKTIKFTEVMEGYSEIIQVLTNLNVIATSEKTAGGVGKRLSSMNILIDAQEGAGRFRGYASSILAADKPVDIETIDTLSTDFITIALNINSKGILLTNEAKEIRNEFLNLQELSRATDVFHMISKKHELGNYESSSTQIWDDTTLLISYIERIVEDGFTTIQNLNITLQKNIKSELQFNIIITIITAILIIISSGIVIRYISLRISKVTDRLIEMSEGGGDLTNHLDIDINDEIGRLSEAFNNYMKSLSKLISGIKILGINFVEYSIKIKELITDVNSSKTVVFSSLKDIEKDIIHEKETIIVMKGEMDNVGNSSLSLSQAVEEQTTAVEESSAAVEQMLANIKTVSVNVEKTANIVSDLTVSGSEGKGQLNRVTKEINNVSELSNSLKNANTLIADIADRTSLLSMNAAIEAAHAGDAGKGFAVVADEIRKLSESTASQSKGITENLNQIISAIMAAVTSSIETEKTFVTITDKIELVSQNQEQIKNAMMEQNQGSNEILEAITLLKNNSYTVDDAVSDLNVAGEKMQNEETEVFNIIKHVKTSVKEMNVAVSNIDGQLDVLTKEEEKNNALVSALSSSMDLFTVE